MPSICLFFFFSRFKWEVFKDVCFPSSMPVVFENCYNENLLRSERKKIHSFYNDVSFNTPNTYSTSRERKRKQKPQYLGWNPVNDD